MNQPLQEDLDFLAHFGVKGMKWGVRNNPRANEAISNFTSRNNDKTQKNINRVARVANGSASKTDKFIVGMFQMTLQDLVVGGGLKGASADTLNRAKETQAKIDSGKKRATDILNKAYGIDISKLDYSY